jgi:hypothetical protein
MFIQEENAKANAELRSSFPILRINLPKFLLYSIDSCGFFFEMTQPSGHLHPRFVLKIGELYLFLDRFCNKLAYGNTLDGGFRFGPMEKCCRYSNGRVRISN